jgi:hypothetical protein
VNENLTTLKRHYLGFFLLRGGAEDVEADRSSASQEIPLILWNPRFHHRIHKSQPLSRALSQTTLTVSLSFHSRVSKYFVQHLTVNFLVILSGVLWQIISIFYRVFYGKISRYPV